MGVLKTMRMRHKPWARPELAACPYFKDHPTEYRGNWHSQYQNPDAPLHLELGCGKGTFTARMALDTPQVNFLAVDIKSEVLAVARRNVSALFCAQGRQVENLLLTAHEIELIHLILSPEDVVDRLLINFCNPWPRTPQHKKRLTHPKQLILYSSFLREGAQIWFKTDDDGLFRDSQEYFTQWGFPITYLTYDLHASDYAALSPSSEHEDRFTAQGIPTKFLVAVYEGERTDATIEKLLPRYPRFRPQTVPAQALLHREMRGE